MISVNCQFLDLLNTNNQTCMCSTVGSNATANNKDKVGIEAYITSNN